MVLNIRRFLYPSLLFLLFLSLVLTIYFMVRALQFDSGFSRSASYHLPRYHFVLIPEEMDNPYWKRVEKGAQAAAKKYDAVVEYNGPAQSNTDEHVKITKMAIASKVDGIITQGLNSKMTPVINDSIEQGIPVITIESDAPKSRRLAYIGTNNYKAGELAGRTLARATGGRANVAIITGSFTDIGQRLRVKGFRDAVKRDHGIKIVDVEASNISRVQAAEKTYEIFKNYPDVTAFYGTSALDGSGISAMVQSLGKTKDVYILAFDALPGTLKLINQGIIDATVKQDPYKMGYRSVKLMVQILNGKNVNPINNIRPEVVTRANLTLRTSAQAGAGDPF